jgi:hypothetical protein
MGIVNFEPLKNFWEMNPAFKGLKYAGELYVKDKSKNKKNSSDLMWCICYVKDLDSPYRNISYSERVKVVCDTRSVSLDYFLENSKVVEEYDKLNETAPMRALSIIDQKIDERNQFLDSLPYSSETAELIEKMMNNSAKIFEEREKAFKIITKRMEQEKEGGTMGSVINDVIEQQKKLDELEEINEKDDPKHSGKKIFAERDSFFESIVDN